MTNTNVKNHTTTRELVLKVKMGAKPVSSTGLIDNRLYNGNNKLYAYLDPIHLLWRVKYADGTIPEALRQNWTKFSYLYEYVKNYYEKRNLDIVEVKDVYE